MHPLEASKPVISQLLVVPTTAGTTGKYGTTPILAGLDVPPDLDSCGDPIQSIEKNPGWSQKSMRGRKIYENS